VGERVGQLVAFMKCRCGFRSWLRLVSKTEIIRGIPCPKCNGISPLEFGEYEI